MMAGDRASAARRAVIAIVWIALTIALVIAVPRLPWGRAFADLRRVDAVWLAIAVVANFAILPLWALEWRLIAPAMSVSFRRMFEVVSITAAVLNSIPLLAGEASAVALLITRGGLSRGAALSVLAVDQLLVAFAKLTVVALAAALAPLPEWLRGGLLLLSVLLVAAMAVLLAFAHRGSHAERGLLAAPSSTRRLLASVAAWGRHLEVLRDAPRSAAIALLALAKKGAELGAVIAIQMAFGLDPAIGTAALVLAALALSTMLPVAPANLGVYEATVFGVYRYAGLPAETALGLAVLQHLCFLAPPLVTGYATLTLTHLIPRRLRAS
jgi:uncharacterized membrane protein YbhN (UPF0104 family)